MPLNDLQEMMNAAGIDEDNPNNATLLFWNTERLGEGTRDARMGSISNLLEQANQPLIDLILLCEITSDTDVANQRIIKQAQVHTRRRGQLGYGAISDPDVILEDVEIPNFDVLFGEPSYKKGGNNFHRQSKRTVAYAGELRGVDIYVYHANASKKASFLVSWVTEALVQNGRPFVLVGDLNCEPSDLLTTMACLNMQPPPNVRDNGQTHHTRKGLRHIYDYAVSSSDIALRVLRVDVPALHLEDASDHLPIIVNFEV